VITREDSGHGPPRPYGMGMEDPLEQYEKEGCTIQIFRDDEGFNPREDCDGLLGVMLCAHRNYNLGDEQIGPEGPNTTVTCPECKGDRRHTLCQRCEGTFEVEVSLMEYLRLERGTTVILPLGLLDHSGLHMYVGAGAHLSDPGGWDSGQVGVIFDTAEARRSCGCEDWDEARIEESLRAEVKEYDTYLRGECYGYVIKDAEGDETDSCWGFLGDIEECKREAEASLGSVCV